MFLSNTINSPIPYIANEDDLTVVRKRRANWKKGSTESKYFSMCEEHDQPHNYWICHAGGGGGGNDQLLHFSPKIDPPRLSSSVEEYVYKKHVDCTPKVSQRPCFVETRHECPSIPKLCKYSSKKIECIQSPAYKECPSIPKPCKYSSKKIECIQSPAYKECPSIPKPCKYSSKKIECIHSIPPPPSDKECYKVTVEQPSMVPTELAPKYQVKAGKILRICACNKRNGLQDHCEMSRCMGRKECLTKPVPVCEPSGTQELVKKVYEVCCEYGE